MTTVVGVCLWLGTVLATESPDNAASLTTNCELRFASAEQGRQILTTADAFTAQLSRFDLQARLKTEKDVTLADWKQFVTQQVRDWQPAEITAVSGSVERV